MPLIRATITQQDPSYKNSSGKAMSTVQALKHIYNSNVSYSNPRGPTTTRVAILSGFLVALPGILAGAKLSVSGDITEKWFGYCSMTFGAFFAIVLPISFPMMVKEYAKLSKKRQHEFIGESVRGAK